MNVFADACTTHVDPEKKKIWSNLQQPGVCQRQLQPPHSNRQVVDAGARRMALEAVGPVRPSICPSCTHPPMRRCRRALLPCLTFDHRGQVGQYCLRLVGGRSGAEWAVLFAFVPVEGGSGDHCVWVVSQKIVSRGGVSSVMRLWVTETEASNRQKTGW